MGRELEIDIRRQPDDTTCGPTCLHAVYRYYGDALPLEQVIAEVPALPTGGTMGAVLGCHALRRGYEAQLYSYNLLMFDPTWFSAPGVDLCAKLREQLRHRDEPRTRLATEGYIEFVQGGGRVLMEDLGEGLLRRYLERRIPLLAGLSATYLYRSPREFGPDDDEDDVRGEPAGHFVVLCGYDAKAREVTVADPQHPNPLNTEQPIYRMPVERVLCAILLGVVTYDANLLVISPAGGQGR